MAWLLAAVVYFPPRQIMKYIEAEVYITARSLRDFLDYCKAKINCTFHLCTIAQNVTAIY